MVYGQPILTKYPAEVRKFCYAMNYHSPAAYRIVRNQFDKCLPHPKTLTTWLQESDINGEHGIREETMKRLARFVKDLKDSTGEQLICTLMLDEMHIRKQVYWDQNKFEYTGYPTYPSNENDKTNVNENDAPRRRKSATEARTIEPNCQKAVKFVNIIREVPLLMQ